MEMHLATVWESISDAMPDELAIVNGDVARTWREYDDRAARVAAALADAGLGLGSKFGLYLYNSNEYLEAQFAGFKARAVPINVNYRYLGEELRYVLDNSDSEALFFHSSLGERVATCSTSSPACACWWRSTTAARAWCPARCAMTTSSPPRADAPHRALGGRRLHALHRRHDRHAEGGDVRAGWHHRGLRRQRLPDAQPPDGHGRVEVARAVAKVRAEGRAMTTIPCCPLMHGTGVWLGAFVPHLTGGTV